MKNNLNLPEATVTAIERLSAEQLAAVRLNIQSREYSDEQTREAIAEYIADGGSIEDLLGAPEAKPKFFIIPDDADFFGVDFAGKIFDSREGADAFARLAYLGADENGEECSWTVKQVPEEMDIWAGRYERAAYITVSRKPA